LDEDNRIKMIQKEDKMSELNNIFRPEGKLKGVPGGWPCPTKFIQTNHENNTITFTVQEGPIKENGINGCQIDNVIWAIAEILRSFNKRFPCRENSCAITHLDEAMMWLEKRKKDREERDVEGQDKE
jgi:hypothetical protein